MLSLAERVDRTILRYSLLPPGARVIVALSGGADSTALACLLVEIAARRGFLVVAAAHFDHRLRPAAALDDEAFCRRLAEQLGIGWTSGAGDVHAFAQSHGLSLEDAGRRLRYDFLRRAAGECQATHVAVGHTLNDQAETVLLQMFRGAGPRGLGGMARVRRLAAPPTGRLAATPAGGETATRPTGTSGAAAGEGEAGAASPRAAAQEVWLVRPLLDVSHDNLVAWLADRGQPFRKDASNADLRFARNRLRHEIIPFLRGHVSPAIEAVLARNADIAASDAELLDRLTRQAYAALVTATAGRLELDAAALSAQPDALRRRLVLLALRNLGGARFVGRDQVTRLLALSEGRIHGPVALPGARAALVLGRLIIERASQSRSRPAELNFSRSALSIPGEARVASAIISSFLCPWRETASAARVESTTARAEAVVDASRISALAVRTRRPGDWLRPLGMGGRRKKLQDYFVDRKVPRELRDSVPLVVDQADRIVWVAGHGIDEEFRVSEGTHDVVILRMRGDSA